MTNVRMVGNSKGLNLIASLRCLMLQHLALASAVGIGFHILIGIFVCVGGGRGGASGWLLTRTNDRGSLLLAKHKKQLPRNCHSNLSTASW